ncbi:MAG: beta-1,3-glucanase family protein [Clostridia bacterium]|nr:beta-1,3-glucanase family protein [Clostridia bacterium]
MLKRMLTITMIVCMLVSSLFSTGVLAADNSSDYLHTVNKLTASSSQISFTSKVNTQWVDVHYKINSGNQLNYRMTRNGSTFTQDIENLNHGDVISYSFTYNNGTPAYNTPWFESTHGAPSEPTPNPVDPGEIPIGNGVMTFQLQNGTGQYSDDEIYWAILGYDPRTGNLCYADKKGNLIPSSVSDNDAPGHLTKNGENYPNYFYKMSETDWVSLPEITSGRMFISIGSPMYIKVNMAADGRTGFAGPDLNNPTDPNQNLYFDWIEFTIDQYGYHGNTTRVDQFSFPLTTRLLAANGYDRIVGENKSRESIFKAFEAEVPDKFKTLIQAPYRIVAPGKGEFGPGGMYSNYFDSYVDEVWNYYRTNELIFTCEAGTFRGRVQGDDFVFSKNGGPYNLYIHGKPSTINVLEGSGNLAAGSSDEKVVQAQICAALNRHMMYDPANWGNSDYFYRGEPANLYAKFWHDHSIDGLAYGFCYDDVRNYSTLLEHPDPEALVITIGSFGSNVGIPDQSTAPTLMGVEDKTINLNEGFEALDGVEAHDREDGNLTSEIKVTGTVDNSKVGTYTLTYRVTDSKGLTTTRIRTITVKDSSNVEDTYDPNKAYVGGDVVIYKGEKYRARWWTQGEAPDKSSVWEKISEPNEDGSVNWYEGMVCVQGDRVVYNGKVYEAKWWTNSVPGSDDSWKLINN